MSQLWKIKAALLVIALVHAGCADPEQGASSGAASGGSTSVSSAVSSTGGGSSGEASSSSSEASSASTGQPPSNPAEVDCRTPGDGKSTLAFINRCDQPLQFLGSLIDGGELGPGQFACRDVGTSEEPLSSLRYWAYSGSDPGGGRTTLAEMTLNTDFNDFDWYNISHVDAHNLPMAIVPVDLPDCRTLACPESLLARCPEVGRYEDASGATISCVSPDRDDPTNPVAVYFEEQCKDAYSWSGDDQESMAACAGEDYDIVFCP
ncbi:thaumatin family protein [Sorangium sp. So ce260]|uniref:thaumatin family protein n=1 Tax=Sorangium sp. So ce260 TaxID=3133291 RepID=UPI003F5DAA8D